MHCWFIWHFFFVLFNRWSILWRCLISVFRLLYLIVCKICQHSCCMCVYFFRNTCTQLQIAQKCRLFLWQVIVTNFSMHFINQLVCIFIQYKCMSACVCCSQYIETRVSLSRNATSLLEDPHVSELGCEMNVSFFFGFSKEC